MSESNEPTTGLVEIVVRAQTGDDPSQVAAQWATRLNLADGVRVSVMSPISESRPRRYVIYGGQVTSTQHYAALSIMDDVEALLRASGQTMDAWAMLQYARQNGSPISRVPMATISRAARIMERAGRLKAGPERGTWKAVQSGHAAA